MIKDSKLYSIVNNKCPRCHEGDFFVHDSIFNVRKFSAMHNNCDKCGLSYQQEPGYYYGAMYVSYAINVAIMVAVWIAYLVLASELFSIWYMVLASMIIGILLTPLTFRIARLTWINFFIRYRGKVTTVDNKE